MAAEAPKYQNMPEWACLVEGELLGDKYISKKKEKRIKIKIKGVPFTPRPLSYTSPYPTLPLPGALCCVSSLVQRIFDQSWSLVRRGDGALLWVHFGHRSRVFDASWRW